MSDLLTKKEQKELLKIARQTVVGYVTNRTVPAITTTPLAVDGAACHYRALYLSQPTWYRRTAATLTTTHRCR